MVDTATLLPQVEVRQPQLRSRPVGVRSERYDAVRTMPYLGQHLGDLLAQEGGTYIRSYGGSSLATASIRGGSAAQTAVLWNGLPLQSPMLGVVDLSLLPVGFFDQMEVKFGGHSPTWGSGAVGGVIALGNEPGLVDSLRGSLRLSGGSFGLVQALGKLSYGQRRLGGNTRLLYHRANNDFPYQVGGGQPLQRLDHAALQQGGIMQDIYWRPDPSQIVSLSLWGQWSDRQLPPTTVQNISLASQEDAFLRAVLNWRVVQEKVIWQTRLGLFREYLDFRDERAGIRSISKHWLSTGELSGEWFVMPHLRIHFGATLHWAGAETPGYDRRVSQTRTAPFLLTRLDLGAWKIQASARQEMVDGRAQPLAPAFAIEGEPFSWLKLRARLSRNYRIPTLNDLYWIPGGNPDLRPENGWSQELGGRIQDDRSRWRWYYEVNLYSRLVKDWMLWSQLPGQSFFSVNNITQVWSRGLEQRFGLTRQAEGWTLGLLLGLDLQRSTNEKAVERPQLEVGEQLPYTPTRIAFLSVRWQWRGLDLGYRHRFTSAVPTLSKTEMEPFQVGDAHAAWTFSLSRHALQGFFRLRNIWNTSYRVIEFRPMPGRNVELGLTWSLYRVP